MATAWTYMLMGYDYAAYFGGNTITNYGNECRNIEVDHAWFNSWWGFNNFNVSTNTNSYNLYGCGTLNEYALSPTHCCFNCPNGNAIYNLTDTLNNQLALEEELPHNCNSNPNEDVAFMVSQPFNMVDTFYRLSDTLIANFSYVQNLYTDFSTNILKKKYDSASIKGTELLSNYTDSIYAPEIISKLYYAYSMLDSTGSNKNILKTFYEQLIINHSQNIPLVKSANYFIQKCKVSLKQYQSALIGFEDIIIQNPYSYEGILASWDYAATQLLLDTLPGSGGFSNNDFVAPLGKLEFLIDSLRIKKMQKYDNYNKSDFNSSGRTELFRKTGNVLIDERNKQIQKFKELQNDAICGNSKKELKAKKDLENLKIIKEVVKIKKPKSQNEYLTIINNDINKLVKKRNINSTNINVNIPTSFNLSQNYPNPFNPVTKINYELPKDGKVKLVIYDILGREIKTLVNELKQAGRYTVEFNGNNYASGVYFYRIQVEGGKSYTAVKKMVLIK